jgi:sugar phosphate isomerase/epimerase
MKFFISLYNIHQLSEPNFILQSLKKYDSFFLLDGIEIKANLDNPIECVRLSEYASHLKEDNLSLQIHVHDQFSDYYDQYKKLTAYLKYYQSLADIMKETLKITIHPIEHEKPEKALYRTIKLLARLNAIKRIYQLDLEFIIENIQDKALDYSSILKQSLISYCWDIGREVKSNTCDYHLKDLMKSKLLNVHIHDVYKEDHQPLIYGNTDYLKSIEYLLSIQYQNALVVEVKYEYLKGNNWYEKFEDYLEQVCILKNVTQMLEHDII